MNNDLVALILAGGIGKRFWPLIHDKVTFPFYGQPFVNHCFLNFIPKQVNRLVIIANRQNYKYFQTQKYPLRHQVVLQAEAGGMAKAILSAEEVLQDSKLLLIIGDHYIKPESYSDIVQIGIGKKLFAVIPAWETQDYFPGGYLKLNKNRIQAIVEKPKPGSEPSKYTVASGHYFSNAGLLISKLKKVNSRVDDEYETAITEICQNEPVEMYMVNGPSLALKYPWDILGMHEQLSANIKSYRGKNIVIKNNVVIEGEVYIGNNAKIFENTKITGPCYIGDNTIIGNNNIIRSSHIGGNCVTGFNTDITRSYIGDNCWFHSNYIGDSVLEENISMGSGAVLANLRLDDDRIKSSVKSEKINTGKSKLGAIIGKYVRIGVNVSIMPGVKIGSKTYISSGCVVGRDVPENSFLSCRSDYQIIPNKFSQPSLSREKYRQKI